MPGPVFLRECVSSSRRWQSFALRVGLIATNFLALLLVGARFLLVSTSNVLLQNEMAQFAKAFFYAFASMQLSLVIVTVPAISAGAFSLDKARGTLTHMLVTQLSSHEIVVDTFLAR